MGPPVVPIVAGGADPNQAIREGDAAVGGQWQSIPVGKTQPIKTWFGELFHTLYGEMSPSDLLRVVWFAGTLFFIIGGYWLLRSLKDPVMVSLNGVEYIPQAKMVSLVVVFGLVFVYNKLMDMVPKHQLFYYVGLFYFFTFSIVAYLLAHPTYGLPNTQADPSRILGWFSYCAIESFGSIGVSLFWAFVNATIDLEGAKRAYGLIIAGAQIGSIIGPSLVIQAHSIGVPMLYFIGALCMLFMVLLVFLYVQKFGSEIEGEKNGAPPPPQGKGQKKGKPGVMEGFTLFMQHQYVRGIFALSCLFMVEVTILDYIMKVLAKRHFSALYPGDPLRVTDEFASFMGLFGQVTNSISFLFSLTGTSFVIRRLGLYKSLIAFPLLCLIGIGAVVFVPTLWVVFGSMMFLKALSYSLNNPCKEMLYNPTSTAVKFKSKSWIDIFGQRGAKAAGSVVTNALSDSVTNLVHFGGLVSVGISIFLVWVAAWMGNKFEEYTETGFIVGQDPVTPSNGSEVVSAMDPTEPQTEMTDMAAEQNRGDDTSCGILEEGQAEEVAK